MSGQGSQRVRRSSPCKQGPMRATLPVSSLLRQGSNLRTSESNSPTLSPNTTWRTWTSPEAPLSGQRSPGSLSYRVKSKTLSARPCHTLTGGNSTIRRTASLDTIYLQGHWPRDSFNLQVDKATQTDDWCGDGKKPYRHIDSASNEDKLEKYIRHRLQRSSKESGSSRERTAAFGLIMSPASSHYSDHSAVTSPSASSQTSTASGSPLHKAVPVNIPAPKQSVNRPPMRSSIEGLNQEIERLVLKATKNGSRDQEREEEKTYQQPTPEGHRAPVADLLRATRSRSVNTQTPAATLHSSQSSGPPSRESASPLVAGVMDLSRPASDSQGGSGDSSPDREAGKFGTSPHINKFLAREPPDGCEKVNLKFTEDSRRNVIDLSSYCPIKPCVSFQLKPSLGSAFISLQTSAASTSSVPVNGTETPSPDNTDLSPSCLIVQAASKVVFGANPPLGLRSGAI